ncbi:hypothetical protein MIB92_18395, partial [Aestuariirhabdus sp. Z084]|uniref:hypothetical protein n=1 Tax=Aestuariirhabdus haliotis TaxID=2918751 RepID=UPI00201B3D60
QGEARRSCRDLNKGFNTERNHFRTALRGFQATPDSLLRLFERSGPYCKDVPRFWIRLKARVHLNSSEVP